MAENTIDSMLGFTAGKIGDIDGKVNNNGDLLINSTTEASVSASTPTVLNITLPKAGVYVVTGSCEWGTDNANLITLLTLFDKANNRLANERNTMANGGGSSIAGILEAEAGDTVRLQISWSGGSGSVKCERIKFRAVRVGGGNRLKRIFSRLRRAVRV